MSLDPRFMIAPSLQEYFVDKTTGEPLAGGFVYFYQDINRTTPKDVYEISGTPPNYNYAPLSNPVQLSAVGTFQDNSGNDVLPYYFPYTGLPSGTSTTIDLYYIVVTDSIGIPQFTREGWPNLTGPTGGSSNGLDIINYAANGQFLLHNDNPPAIDANPPINGIDYQAIAQGGWYFARSNGSTATDAITFPIFQDYVSTPSGSPRFAAEIDRTVASLDEVCDFRLRFNDVNKFASPDGQEYIFQFTGQSNSGSVLNGIDITLYKYFGSGGSPSTPTNTVIETVGLTTSETVVSVLIDFGTNAGDIIGTNNDDFVEICISFPAGSSTTFNAQITDVILTPNENLTIDVFPTTPDENFVRDSVAGYLPVPNPDGSDLFLPLVCTNTGMDYDRSDIGTVVAAGNLSNFSGSICTNGNRLLADGSQYLGTDYSDLGIPYARLQSYYMDGGASNVPQFGTGANFATAYIEAGDATKLIFTLNKLGAQTAPANGGASPTFSYLQLIAGSAGFNFAAYNNGSTLVTSICGTVGAALAGSSSGTSGMTVVDDRNSQISTTYYAFNLTALSSAALGNGAGTGKYFDFSNTTINYRMWFQTATETAPAAGGRTLIKLNLDLTMTAADVAGVIASAISGFQDYQITAASGASITAGSYFTFVANSQAYVVWYTLNGGGSQPSAGNAIYIPVAVTSGMSAAQVAAATQLAINSTYFAVPNLKGLFLRGYDDTGRWDIDYLSRFSTINTLTGGNAGTMELDYLASHSHTGTVDVLSRNENGGVHGVLASDAFGATDLTTTFNLNINATGGSETRPVNMSVVWAVKY